MMARLLVLLSAVLLAASAAQGLRVFPTPRFALQHVLTNRCAHTENDAAVPGSNSKLYLQLTCSYNSTAQAFFYTTGGSLRHEASGMCLKIQGGTSNPPNGASVQLGSSCDSADTRFEWETNYAVKHIASGKCMRLDTSNPPQLVIDSAACEVAFDMFAPPPAACSSGPTFQVDGGAWPASCANTNNGGTCTAVCSTTPAGPAPQTTCVAGSWNASITGSCAAPASCTNGPAAINGVNWATCSGTASGGVCTSSCATGYKASGDTPTATCTDGAWGSVTGACVGKSCSKAPGAVGTIFPSTCAGTSDGGTCVGTCKLGYSPNKTPASTDQPTTTCRGGSWSPVVNQCALTDKCRSIHRACTTCREIKTRGTQKTELQCTMCDTQWLLRQDGTGKICDCKAGFRANGTGDGTDNWCVPCPIGPFCPGGGVANPLSASRNCSNGLATRFTGSKSLSQCFTAPGWGRVTTKKGNKTVVEAVLCPIATYNVGGNTAGCTKCPAGMTTIAPGASALTDCLAPPGSYLEKSLAARPCPKGTLTEDYNRLSICNPCPDGTTTEKEGANSSALCNWITIGRYFVTANTTEKCAIGMYNDREGPRDQHWNCTLCPWGFSTRATGSTGDSDCLVPPGWELKDQPPLPTSRITVCPIGWYKEGWNRNPCLACGAFLDTDDIGSTSREDCRVPAGWGLVSLSPFIAQRCLLGSYGVNTSRPAGAAATCVSCRPNMFTLDQVGRENRTEGYVAEENCVVKPGWGVTESGLVERCPLGFVNAGYNRQPCAPCDAGFWGIPADPTDPDSMTVCVIQPGWEFDTTRQLPKPCDKGTWSPGGNLSDPDGNCNPCPSGYTTQEAESTTLNDCNFCAAGYGGADCTPCPYNTYKGADGQQADACSACPAGTVSSRGRADSSFCVPEFVSPINDMLGVSSAAALTAAPAPTATQADCEAACKDDAGCALYTFNAAASSPDFRKCFLLLEDSSGAQVIALNAGRGVDYSLFRVAAGLTVGALVQDVSGTGGLTPAQCLRECTKSGSCELASFDAANLPAGSPGRCVLYKSELDAEWVGSARMQGSRLFTDLSV